MKKTIISIVIVMLAIAAVVFVVRMKPADKVQVSNDQVAGTESKYLVTHEPQLIAITEETPVYTISGSYPQFPQADEAFNAKIAKIVTDGVEQFKQGSDDNYKAQLDIRGNEFQDQFADTGGYTYRVATTIVQSNDSYISALVRFEGFSGGAHGYHGAVSFNYDVKNKKELLITNFITLEQASRESRVQLIKKLATDSEEGDPNNILDQMIGDGTDPKVPENFQTFTFVNNTLTIYFGEYQVAPYVYGEQSVELQLEKTE